MKNIYYVANVRIPTERAHGIQIVKTCEAFANQGFSVELIVPLRQVFVVENPFQYYGVKDNFKIKKLWCLDLARFGYLGFWFQMITFAWGLFWYVLFKKGVFYTRDEFLAFCFKLMGKKVFWESHTGQKNLFVKFLIWFNVPVVVISLGLKNLYIKLGMSEKKILVAPDAVDIEKFNQLADEYDSKTKIMQELGLSKNEKLVVYAGTRQGYKGTDTLEKAGKLIENIKIIIISDKPHVEIPKYLKAADILVLPNSGKTDVSRLYTSPMKLFEYMASGTPVAASNLPSIREVLDESEAYFFEADNPVSLAQVVKRVFAEYDKALDKAQKAREKVKNYTWQKRSMTILKFIND